MSVVEHMAGDNEWQVRNVLSVRGQDERRRPVCVIANFASACISEVCRLYCQRIMVY